MSNEKSAINSFLNLFLTPVEELNEKQWLLPRFCWLLYVIALYLSIFIAAGCLLGSIPWALATCRGMESVPLLFIAVVVIIIAFFVQCILLRLIYETILLLFVIFRTERETNRMIEDIGKTLSRISHTQMKSGQYICDCLADISDTMKGIN